VVGKLACKIQSPENGDKNRRGPNIEPWGTPAFIVSHSEFDPFKTTRWDRPERYLSNHTKRLPDIPYCLYVTVDTPQNAADIINRDLEKIH
jgi:hypothetical protein